MVKIGLIAAVIAGFALAALPAVLSAATTDAATPPSAVCSECCEGDAVCETLAGLADLRSMVGALVPEHGLANSLEVKVDAATRSVLAARYGTALRQLDALDHEVTAAETAGKLGYLVFSKILAANHEMKKKIIANFPR